MKFFCFMFIIFCSFLDAGIYLEKPDDFHPKPAMVGCCFLHYQDKILILHRQDCKHEGNHWGIPGGKLQRGEPILEATVREVFEETGFQLDVEKVVHPKNEYLSGEGLSDNVINIS